MKKFFALIAVVALVAFAAPAFAANPFMDVPMNSWAYDAVGQLAASGIVSGYPDGTFKGNQPITRYEMASVTARALAVIDMEKASKQDVEMLKRLVVEFKDELDALGVSVDKLDSRVAVLEENIGGWKFWGEFRFDAKFSDGQNAYITDNVGDDTSFSVSRYRIWMSKQIDDKVSFVARIGANDGTDLNWDRYYLNVSLPWDVNMMVGRWLTDWEGDDGLYNDNDAMFTDRTRNGFNFSKSFGMGEFAAYVAHGDLGLTADVLPIAAAVDGYEYGVRAKFNFNETFWMSLNGIWFSPDYIGGVAADADVQNLWAAAGVNFNPNIAFKVMYVDQDIDAFTGAAGEGNLLKAIIDVKQDALKFTSLWIEYNSFDDNFTTITDDPWNNYGGGPFGRTLGAKYDSLIFVKAEQKWNDKWTTFERYASASANALFQDTKNMTFGVKYYYTPALSFELAYDDIQDRQGVANADDHLIRLRTHVKF